MDQPSSVVWRVRIQPRTSSPTLARSLWVSSLLLLGAASVSHNALGSSCRSSAQPRAWASVWTLPQLLQELLFLHTTIPCWWRSLLTPTIMRERAPRCCEPSRSSGSRVSRSLISPELVSNDSDSLESHLANFDLQTNEPFLVNVLRHPKFLSGVFDTNFIDENKRLFKFEIAENRAQKLLYYMADVVVNGPSTPLITKIPPAKIIPTVPPVKGTSSWLW